jgi:hypothetical protein
LITHPAAGVKGRLPAAYPPTETPLTIGIKGSTIYLEGGARRYPVKGLGDAVKPRKRPTAFCVSA